MRTVNFRKIEVEINFEGDKKFADVAKELANYCKSKTTDIGFEDFCREIYHKGEVEVSTEQAQAIIRLISANECPFFAFIKRGVINALNSEQESI